MRKPPAPWTPPCPREVYVVHTGLTSFNVKERKYSKSPEDTLIPVVTLTARGPVTAESAHREAMQIARDYVRRGTADSVVVSAARTAGVQRICLYVRETLCPEAAS
jgi:predicted nucleic acid-binding protein